MEIAQSLIDEIVVHAREDAPNECCGLVAGSGVATLVPRLQRAGYPLAYNVYLQDLLRITNEIDDAGEELAAIYHCTPGARLSPRRRTSTSPPTGRTPCI